MDKSRIVIIVPILNEAMRIEALLKQLLPLVSSDCLLVLVDGGSQDGSAELAMAKAPHFMQTKPGRAQQMQAGLALASAQDIVWFLHADVQICSDALQAIRQATTSGALWGRFDVRLSGSHRLFRIIETMMNWRSAITGICTGDQGIFVKMETLTAIGGMPLQPLMEDVELSTRLKKLAMPARLKNKLVVSSRKWEQAGILHTILLMWKLRLAYFFGAPACRLAAIYYGNHYGNRKATSKRADKDA